MRMTTVRVTEVRCTSEYMRLSKSQLFSHQLLLLGVYQYQTPYQRILIAILLRWSFNVMAVQTGLRLHDIVVKTVMAYV